MFCKWCGLESETNDVCSWCRKPFSSPATPVQQKPTPSSPTPRSSPALTESFDDEPPLPSNYAPVTPPQASAPRPDSGASASPAPAAPAAYPLGDSFDDLDDLSPMPYGGGNYQPPRQYSPPAPVNRPAPPAYVPPPRQQSSQLQPPPPIFTPPVSRPVEELPEAAPEAPEPPAPIPATYSPPAPPPPSIPVARDTRPPLEAIPIKLRTPGGAGAGAPPVIPIKTAGARPEPASPAPPTAPPPAFIPPPTSRPAYEPPAFSNSAPLSEAPPAPASPISRVPMPLGDDLSDAPPTLAPTVEMTPGPIDLGLKTIEEAEQEGIASLASPAGRRLDLSGAYPPVTSAAAAPPPPPTRTGVATATPSPVPPRGGRTWYCRWCGMQSENPDTCTWCRRDIRNAPTSGKPAHVTITHAPVKGRAPVKGSVRQPVAKAPTKGKEPLPDLLREVEKAKPDGNGKNGAAPQFGTFQPAKSKYYSEQVYDPVSGKHYTADTGETTDAPGGEIEPPEEPNDVKQLGLYSGILVGICIVSAVLASKLAADSLGMYFGILGIGSFVAGLLLPVLRVVPWSKDDPEDVAWALGLVPLFGPFAGSMGYGVLIVTRSGDFNPAILGVFLVSLLLRVVVDLAAGHPLSKLVPFAELNPAVLGAQIMPLVTLAGWFAGEFFHKHDE